MADDANGAGGPPGVPDPPVDPVPGTPPTAPPAAMPRATDFAKQVVPRPIESELRQSFLDYAMSVIVSRALPDARDGLKPVHRRILYAMSELGMGPTSGYKKSATAVGEVLGKYHPHGDSAIYDAMVRMAQDWSLRYPLVDGQGNFGSVDGDAAAAMRYTEARLAKISAALLDDLDKETVDWQPNYDGRLQEPLVLPSAIPNLLVNGADGIAVGMATKIAPHNLGEVIDACVRLIDEPNVGPLDLLEQVQGPDFPTGGIIHGRSGILQAMVSGRGRLVVRGRHEVEQMGGDRERIVFVELPYQVNKAQLLMQIAELAKDKVIEGIADLRDESDRRGMRMVIELKRDAITDVVLNQLWKHTPLQSTFSINNLALVDGRPRTLGLRDLLRTFLDHRMAVVTRRTRHELAKAEARAHVLEGLLIALDRLDEVIELIRTSRDPDEARSRLMGQAPAPPSALRLRPQGAAALALSEEQAKAILDMRLQRLTGLESDAVRTEHGELLVKIAHYKALLADEGKRYAVIKDELAKIKAEFGDARRTAIEEGEIDIDDESLIPEEESVYMHTDAGYLKRMPLATYREQRRGGKGLRGFKAKEEDHVVGTVVASTHDWLCVFTNRGRIHWLKGYRVPIGTRQGRGKPVVNLLQFEEGEMIETIIPVRDFEEAGAHVFFATKKGVVKRTKLDLFKNIRAAGIHAIDLLDGDELLAVRRTDGQREVLLATRKGQAVRFPESEVRAMGRAATGVRGITLEEGDEVVSLEIAEEGVEILTVTERGYGKRTPIEEYRRTHRGGKGVRTIVVNERNGGVVAVRSVRGDESVLVTTKEGMVVRSRVEEVSRLGRSTQGVRIMRIEPTDQVNQVAVLPPGEEDESVPEATPERPTAEDVTASGPDDADDEGAGADAAGGDEE